MADAANDPAWHTAILEALKASGGPIGTGATWHQRMKPFMGGSEATAEVVAFEPQRKEVLRGVARPMQPTITHLFEPADGGTTFTRRI